MMNAEPPNHGQAQCVAPGDGLPICVVGARVLPDTPARPQSITLCQRRLPRLASLGYGGLRGEPRVEQLLALGDVDPLEAPLDPEELVEPLLEVLALRIQLLMLAPQSPQPPAVTDGQLDGGKLFQMLE